MMDFSIAEDNRSSSPMSQREGNSHLISRREGYLTPNHFARSASLGVAGRTPINPMHSNPSSSTGKFYLQDVLNIDLKDFSFYKIQVFDNTHSY